MSTCRNDEYGGSLENRVRLLREMVEDTREAVGDTCAVAVRFSVDELMGELGLQWHDEGRGVFELVGELPVPDLWDLKTFGVQDSSNARYSEEGYQEPYVAFARQMTSKPVVGVGRFTSPDAMVSQIKRGVLDLIGAARPSISAPFLPKKIPEHVLEFGFRRVVAATGARWTTALCDARSVPVPATFGGRVLTPDDIMAGAEVVSSVVVFDFDQYYMGGCLSGLLAENGHRVTYVTPADLVSAWCGNTHDQWYAQQRLIELGVTIITGFFVSDFDGGSATLSGRYAGEVRDLEAATLAVVGAREPQDALYRTLAARAQDLRAAGIRTLQKIGDCDVPGAVVHATYAGHRLAREFDANVAPMLFERTRLDN